MPSCVLVLLCVDQGGNVAKILSSTWPLAFESWTERGLGQRVGTYSVFALLDTLIVRRGHSVSVPAADKGERQLTH